MAVAKKAVKKTATKKTVAKRSTVPASAARKARAGGRRIDVHSHVVPAELLQAIERDPARFQMKIEARDGSQKIVREGGHAFPVYPEFSDPAVKVAGMDRKGLDVSFISPAPIVMMYWLGVDAAAEALARSLARAEPVELAEAYLVGEFELDAEEGEQSVQLTTAGSGTGQGDNPFR